MFLSGPPSVDDQQPSVRPHDELTAHYQQLSAVQTVSGGDERSFVLTGLRPGTLYAVVVAPFADSVDRAASNTVYLQTADDGNVRFVLDLTCNLLIQSICRFRSTVP